MAFSDNNPKALSAAPLNWGVSGVVRFESKCSFPRANLENIPGTTYSLHPSLSRLLFASLFYVSYVSDEPARWMSGSLAFLPFVKRTHYFLVGSTSSLRRPMRRCFRQRLVLTWDHALKSIKLGPACYLPFYGSSS